MAVRDVVAATDDRRRCRGCDDDRALSVKPSECDELGGAVARVARVAMVCNEIGAWKYHERPRY